jgi:hypothetical protein
MHPPVQPAYVQAAVRLDTLGWLRLEDAVGPALGRRVQGRHLPPFASNLQLERPALLELLQPEQLEQPELLEEALRRRLELEGLVRRLQAEQLVPAERQEKLLVRLLLACFP